VTVTEVRHVVVESVNRAELPKDLAELAAVPHREVIERPQTAAEPAPAADPVMSARDRLSKLRGIH
jgi:hypothetical protein